MTNYTAPGLLTIAELARILDLPESTTRYYCNRFAAHLPSVGEGRRRRYKPEAQEALRGIARTMRRDKNAYAVDLALRDGAANVSREAAFAGSAQLAGQVMALMENQTKALQDIAAAMGVFAERLSPAAPPATATDVAETAALREEIAALRDRIRESEAVHQNDLEQLRKWLTRLGEALAAK